MDPSEPDMSRILRFVAYPAVKPSHRISSLCRSSLLAPFKTTVIPVYISYRACPYRKLLSAQDMVDGHTTQLPPNPCNILVPIKAPTLLLSATPIEATTCIGILDR